MTSSSEQPPKEYIITEFQLKQLQDFASLEFVCQAIRKRPHPAPQEDGCKFRVAKMEAMYDNGYADGSRKAREDVAELLDDVRKYANGEYKEADLSDNEREMRIHLEYENRIWGIMRSLRTTPPQTEHEQGGSSGS